MLTLARWEVYTGPGIVGVKTSESAHIVCMTGDGKWGGIDHEVAKLIVETHNSSLKGVT